jgi:8-oxo-dGTP pyrophosphatase MutT (NUDIX family)
MDSGSITQAADFFARAKARLTLDVPGGISDPNIIPKRGDHDIDPVLKAIADVRPIKPAAVLVPIVERDQAMVLLTQRTAHLTDHAGQISFPGGKIDGGDKTPRDAALREAEEEIGLDRRFVTPIGYLDLYLTTRGYRIVPLVARVRPDFSLRLNRSEVDDAFEVPLGFLMELTNHHRYSREWNGMQRSYFEIVFGERKIWGVTAGILRNLHERVYS